MRFALYFLSVLFLFMPAAFSADGTVGISGTFSKNFYGIRDLDIRAFVYSDRDYVFAAVPGCLSGRPYLVTPNQDKFTTGDSLVTVSSREPVNVYVGYDQRYRTRPDWLARNYQQTRMSLDVVDPRTGQTILAFDLYRSRSSMQNIPLGGNIADSEKSNFGMYTAVFVPANQDNCRI